MRTRPVTLLTGAAATLALALPATPAHAAAPANDGIGRATVVGDLPWTTTQDTTEATASPRDPGCGHATVWFAFTPPTNGSYDLDTAGSDYDTTLAVLTGPRRSPSLVACLDDTGQSLQAALRLELTGGTTYWIQAGQCCGAEPGTTGPGGGLSLSLRRSPPPPVLQLALAPRSSVHRVPGRATVRGSARCTPGTTGTLSVDLRQRTGQWNTVASGSAAAVCDGRWRRWSIEVDNEQRAFRAGSAFARVSGTVCDSLECTGDEAQRTVRLDPPGAGASSGAATDL